MGYFINNNAAVNLTRQFFSGMTGYINPQLAENLGEATADDIVLNVDNLTSIKSATIGAAVGNVYSIDGKLVSKNGVKNLNKGIYIVGKKKVAVK